MANGDGCIAGKKHHSHGLAEDGGAADDDSVLTSAVDVVGVDEVADTRGSGTAKAGKVECHCTKGSDGNAINVFGGWDGFKGGTFIDLLRDWVLEEDAMD